MNGKVETQGRIPIFRTLSRVERARTLAYSSGPRAARAALPSQFNAVLEPLNGKEYLAVEREHFEFWESGTLH